MIRYQIGKHDTYVFTYKGEPVTRANNHAWRKALIRAGIKNFRWHDLRHTWASRHIQNGTPLNVLRELGGWADLSWCSDMPIYRANILKIIQGIQRFLRQIYYI
ncbi:MAG: tyrosine-type recombinase/integrase [Methylovulum sp.]|nr:tyrosine-type recombinase/integrase [Methylovulum sp.]